MIQVLDKQFETFLPAEKIQSEISLMAQKLNEEYAGKELDRKSVV